MPDGIEVSVFDSKADLHRYAHVLAEAYGVYGFPYDDHLSRFSRPLAALEPHVTLFLATRGRWAVR